MKYKIAFFFSILIATFSAQKSFAQEKDTTQVTEKEEKYNPIKLSVAFESLHLWRGIEVNNTPCIEPSVAFQTRDKSWNVGLWYNNAISGTYKEFDYFITYKKKGFVFAIWDIYNFNDSATWNNHQAFNYNAGQTGHFIDADLGYTLQGKYPLGIYTSTIVWGRDRDIANKKNLFSNYTQLTIPAVMNKEVELSLIVGGGFAFRNDKNLDADGERHKGTFYTKNRNADFTNIGFVATKHVNILNHDFPISGTASFNPNQNTVHLMLSTVFF